MKLKPLKPTLRERKRYVMFQIIANTAIDKEDINKAIESNLLDYIGIKGTADAGFLFLKDKYDKKTKTGIIRVTHKAVDNLKASFCMINTIKNNPVIVRSLGVSGILKKTEKWRGE